MPPVIYGWVHHVSVVIVVCMYIYGLLDHASSMVYVYDTIYIRKLNSGLVEHYFIAASILHWKFTISNGWPGVIAIGRGNKLFFHALQTTLRKAGQSSRCGQSFPIDHQLFFLFSLRKVHTYNILNMLKTVYISLMLYYF